MALHSHPIINSNLNDPVAKAVMDNIMGNLPTKKPLVRCEDCDLCFTSQTVLDAHLQGARHAKQIRSKVIMTKLEETKVAFTKDQETNGLTCNVCNVCLNSIQQLQTHLNGNRHKKKATKGGTSPKEVTIDGGSMVTSTSSTSSGSSVTTLSTLIRPSPLSCQLCNKFFNSKAQYDVHILSRKHTQKTVGNAARNKRKKLTSYMKRKKEDIFVRYFVNHEFDAATSLTHNFVSGGYTQV